MAHAMRARAVNKIVTPMILYRLNANAARATVCASAPLASMAWANFCRRCQLDSPKNIKGNGPVKEFGDGTVVAIGVRQHGTLLGQN